MALTTTMQLALSCDKAGDVLLFSGSQNGDIAGLFNLQLMPNAKYRLSVNFIASAQFNYHATSGRLYRLFPPMATSRTRSDSSSPRSGSSVRQGPDTRRPSESGPKAGLRGPGESYSDVILRLAEQGDAA
jgi:hypothetical protein